MAEAGADRKSLAAISLVIFIDLMGFGLILPLLPYYAAFYGAGATTTGLLLSSYAMAQLVGAPVCGRLSDRYGRRPVILLCLVGTAASFVLLGAARSLGQLFVSRILSGLFGGNLSVAQAYVADVTPLRRRAKALGQAGAAVGLGFILGPAVGGSLSHFGNAVPAYGAAALTVLNLLAVVLWLGESLTPARRAALARTRPEGGTSAATLLAALVRPRVGPLLVARFVSLFTLAMFQTIFPIYALNRFQASAQTTAYCYAYVGVLLVLVQGAAIEPLTARFTDRRLMMASIVTMAAAFLAWAWAPSLAILLLILAPLAAAGGTFNTVNNSALTKAVEHHDVGGALGLSTAVESLTRVPAPLLGGWLLERFGTEGPGVATAGMLLLLLAYVRLTLPHEAA